MLLKKVKNRLSILISLSIISLFVIFLILKVLEDNVLYFYSPSDIKNSDDINLKKKIRIGGMVKKGSILSNEREIKFVVTDLNNEIIVSYSGTVPALFAEGKGVVAEGKLKDKKFFIAKRILAKHDENYMPPELKGNSNKNAK
jgi:cytochrome c-type biogenesis protein CcmE